MWLSRNGLFRSAKISVVVGVVVAGSIVAGTGTAHAYEGDPDAYNWALVDTGNCERLSGYFEVVHAGSYCWVDDELDGTNLVRDPGGLGINFTMWFEGHIEPHFKVEWHPYGEHLWVYDAENDADTVYVELLVNGASQGLFSAPGTSAWLDYRDYDLSFAEGADIAFRFWDNSNGTDRILSTLGGLKA